MAKRIVALLLAVIMVLTFVGCTKPATTPGTTTNNQSSTEGTTSNSDFHIGIMTGTTSQGEDEFRAAQALITKYGNVDQGGRVKHLTYPDNFTKEVETTIQLLTGMASDPKMKVIVVNQAVQGTVAAFKTIRETRPDILLFAVSSQEDPVAIEAAADVVIDPDNVNRGYLMILAAQKMGAKKFVHISFPRHMGYQLLSLRAQIMEEACKDLGLEWIMETAPDPTGDVGVQGAQKFIQEQMPVWVQKYGKDTAFFCTNDAQTEPLLAKVAELGAIFVEPDLPSPIMGYPGAFGIDLSKEAGDWPAILKKVEEAVVKAGGSGRMGTWAYSYGYTSTMAMAEYGMGVTEGKYAKEFKLEDVLAAYKANTPGSEWQGSTYYDLTTKSNIKNHFMLYQDTYVFGKGYIGNTAVKVPDKFLKFEPKK